MRRFVFAVCASCAVAMSTGLFTAESVRADERSPFQLLGTAHVATVDGSSSPLQVTPVHWGYRYGYGGYGGYYRPYSSYYRPYGYYGGYGSYYRPSYGGYGSYYRPYYGGYGGYYGYRPGLNFYFRF
jgi:hypothetical protein